MKKLKALRFLFGLLGCLFFQFVCASTTIIGNVTVQGPDAPPGPIAGAFVMVSLQKFPTQVIASTRTDAHGNYKISGLAAGRYQVQFSATGFDDGVMKSNNFKDGDMDELDATLVPSLSGTEVPMPDITKESQFTITNPNPFSVTYQWQLPTPHAKGRAVAPPGTSVIDTKQTPHVEEIQLSVDGVQVQPAQPSNVPPPHATKSLTGYVDDTSGNALGGVTVSLTKLGGGQTSTTYTLTDGSYAFFNESPAFYTLTYTLAGYNAASQLFYMPGGGGPAPTIILTPVAPPPTANVVVTVLDSNNNPTPNVSVTVAYSSGITYETTTNGNGVANFVQQPVGVGASIAAVTNDGSGRSAVAHTSGFIPGTNNLSLTLPPIPTGTVSGTVTDASSNPLSGASVAVLNASNSVVASTTTASNGTYSVSGLNAGTYSMTFSLANYVTGSVGGVAVTSGGTTTENMSLVTVASTQATVIVTVTDGGSPASNASVSIAYANGTNSAVVTTNGSGLAIFSGQPAGLFAIVTAVAGDGSARSISSSPQMFAAGVPTQVSLALPPVNNAIISGKVTDSTTGAAIPGASVTISNNSNVVGSTTTDSGGHYSIGGLGLQTYNVAFSANGYQSAAGLTAGNTTLNQALIPMNATVAVQVEDTYGNAIAGATVSINYGSNEPVAVGTTTGSGSVTFSNQLAGISAVVSAVTADNRTASQTGAFVSGNNSVSLVVSSDYGVVSGVVEDMTTNQPVAGVSVSALDYLNNVLGYAITDGAGNYTIQNLSPGVQTFIFQKAGYQQLSLTIGVAANQTTTANAALSPAFGSISGTVTGSISQSPVPGSQITLTGPSSVSTSTDSNGNYSFTNIRAGSYTGTLSSGIFTQPISVIVIPNQTSTVNLILDTTSVAGTVKDQNGDPVGGAQVVLTGTGFTSATLVTDQFGNYVANRESITGSMTITATYSVLGGGQWVGSEQIVVNSTPPEDVIPPIIINIPSSVNVSVTLNGSPLNGAAVTITYAEGTVNGPVATTGGLAAFNTAIVNSSANIFVQYVDGTGTVYVGTLANQVFVPNANNVSVVLSLAGFAYAGAANIQVVDQNGHSLSGAIVTISYSNGDTSAALTTDGSGSVTFPSQQTGVTATISVSYVDGQGSTWPGTRTISGGFGYGNNGYQVTVVTG